jgi:uncharacterized damage-inducible protein DinB
MAEDRDALVGHYREMRARLLAALDGLPDDLLIAPTLDGWSVKDHLIHLAFWDRIRAAEVIRISAGQDTAWRMTESQNDVLSGLAYDLQQGLSLEQVRWELAISHDRLLEALSTATLVGLDESRYGEAGLRSDHESEHVGWIARWRTEQGR